MRYRTPRRRFIAAHGALRKLLGAYLGLHPSEVAFVHNEFGKPALIGAGPGQFGGRLSFNLSHSGDLALIGIALDAEIGVDVEYIRDEPDFAEIAGWFFAAEEVEELNRLPDELRGRAFLSGWTRTEAYAKARGAGLGGMDEMGQPQDWSLYVLEPAAGYVGAVVVEGSGWRVTHRHAPLEER